MFSKFVFCSLLAFAIAQAQEPTQVNQTDTYKINRVIGGTNAAKGEFPYQISLQFGSPPYMPFNHMCGGSIIGKQWILTAAHCVQSLPPGLATGQFLVYAGKNLVRSSESSVQVRKVERFFVHQGYPSIGGVGPNDIALLKLSDPLSYNEFVDKINLPQADSVPTGNAVLSGWGSTSKTPIPSLPNALQKVTLPILDLNTCRQAMRSMGEFTYVQDTNVCTGPLTGGLSACNGDSGGPLIKESRSRDQRELVGVVSWGLTPCGQFGAPAVFTRVSGYIDWINDITRPYGGL